MSDANRQYTAGNVVEDFTCGADYACEILDPDGDIITYVVVPNKSMTYVESLLSHLNRGN